MKNKLESANEDSMHLQGYIPPFFSNNLSPLDLLSLANHIEEK